MPISAFSVVGGGSGLRLLMCLALKWRSGGLIHLEVPLHDVELPPIVNLSDANQVEVLISFVDTPHGLASDEDTGEMALVVLGSLVPDWLAWVKEASHCGAYSSDAAGVGQPWHGGNEAVPKLWYGTYVFLP
jgi:hypothetical protein